jgi:hypothetical protein
MKWTYWSAILLFLPALSAAPFACGGSVIDAASGVGGAGGSGGAGSAAGAGGAAGSPDGGTGAGGTDAGPIDASKICGGKIGIVCDPGEYCAYDMPGTCGNADGTGVCQPTPDVCDPDCPGVCGCDGMCYCSVCAAHASGVDVSQGTACFPDGAKYSAQNLYTGVPRFAVFKADEVRSICVRIIVEASLNPGPGLAPPDGWAFNKIEITNNTIDCATPNGWPEPPVGATAAAEGGTGSMTLSYPNGVPDPCYMTVHGTLEFAPGAPWVPAVEPLDADNVMVVGGCN